MRWNPVVLEQMALLVGEEYNEHELENAAGYVERLTGEYLYMVTRKMMNQDRDGVKELLKSGYRLDRIIEAGGTEDNLSYCLGIFSGVHQTLLHLDRNLSDEQQFRKKINALCSNEHVEDILVYLYSHPGAWHRKIADKVGIKVNYLSELMRKLEDCRAIERYPEGRNSYYELTIDGQNYMKEKQEERKKADRSFYFKNIVFEDEKAYKELYFPDTEEPWSDKHAMILKHDKVIKFRNHRSKRETWKEN